MTGLLDRYVTEMAALVERLVEDNPSGGEVVGDLNEWATEMARGLLEAGLCGEYDVIAHVAGENEVATYSRLLRGMARRVGEFRETIEVLRQPRNLDAIAEARAESVARPEPPFAPGTLVVYARRKDRDDEHDRPQFALTAADPKWWDNHGDWAYGLHYVQFPERGEATGGSGWSTLASELRLPSQADELVIAARFHAKARVIAAEKELRAAQAEHAAFTTALGMIDRLAPAGLRSNGEAGTNG